MERLYVSEWLEIPLWQRAPTDEPDELPEATNEAELQALRDYLRDEREEQLESD